METKGKPWGYLFVSDTYFIDYVVGIYFSVLLRSPTTAENAPNRSSNAISLTKSAPEPTYINYIWTDVLL